MRGRRRKATVPTKIKTKGMKMKKMKKTTRHYHVR